ncbi:MAG: hypothetical protein AB7E55_33245 [Pigmentiphaga sp.]
MKRYLLLSVGYNHVAVPYSTGPELAAVMASLADAKNVNSVGYGDDEKWVPVSNEPVQIRLIDGARVTIGDDLETLRVQLAQAQQEAKTNSERWMSYYQKSNDLEKKLKEAQGIPQPAPTPESDATPADDIGF